jgi:hypothetical protein
MCRPLDESAHKTNRASRPDLYAGIERALFHA